MAVEQMLHYDRSHLGRGTIVFIRVFPLSFIWGNQEPDTQILQATSAKYKNSPSPATVSCDDIKEPAPISLFSVIRVCSLGQMLPRSGHLKILFSSNATLSADRATTELHSAQKQRRNWEMKRIPRQGREKLVISPPPLGWMRHNICYLTWGSRTRTSWSLFQFAQTLLARDPAQSLCIVGHGSGTDTTIWSGTLDREKFTHAYPIETRSYTRSVIWRGIPEHVHSFHWSKYCLPFNQNPLARIGYKACLSWSWQRNRYYNFFIVSGPRNTWAIYPWLLTETRCDTRLVI